jgi:hypothetical protein
MVQFYHAITTEESWEFLQDMKRNYNFVLIGGWAVFLYSHSLKSKDIDIIIDYQELGKLKEKYDIAKNERLKKYELKKGEFDIDIYLPHYSDLGIDIEKIKNSAVVREGFFVPELEIMLLMKLYAWDNRQGSVKGQKDELDIFSLAVLPEFDWKKYLGFVETFGMKKYHQEFMELLKKTKEIKELDINQQKMARIKKVIFGSI